MVCEREPSKCGQKAGGPELKLGLELKLELQFKLELLLKLEL